jgi:hypothetical protein
MRAPLSKMSWGSQPAELTSCLRCRSSLRMLNTSSSDGSTKGLRSASATAVDASIPANVWAVAPAPPVAPDPSMRRPPYPAPPAGDAPPAMARPALLRDDIAAGHAASGKSTYTRWRLVTAGVWYAPTWAQPRSAKRSARRVRKLETRGGALRTSTANQRGTVTAAHRWRSVGCVVAANVSPHSAGHRGGRGPGVSACVKKAVPWPSIAAAILPTFHRRKCCIKQ